MFELKTLNFHLESMGSENTWHLLWLQIIVKATQLTLVRVFDRTVIIKDSSAATSELDSCFITLSNFTELIRRFIFYGISDIEEFVSTSVTWTINLNFSPFNSRMLLIPCRPALNENQKFHLWFTALRRCEWNGEMTDNHANYKSQENFRLLCNLSTTVFFLYGRKLVQDEEKKNSIT